METQRDVNKTSNIVPSKCKPTINFFSLPSELRNMIYELALVQQESIPIWGLHDHLKISPKLLRASKTIHDEATMLFYGMNRISIIEHIPKEVNTFFTKIGCNNANYIRHVVIDFPEFRFSRLHSVAMEKTSILVFKSIQRNCPNIVTLSMAFDIVVLCMDTGRADHRYSTAALKLADTQFRTIPSLKEIVIESDMVLSSHTKKTIESLGWILNISIINIGRADGGIDEGENSGTSESDPIDSGIQYNFDSDQDSDQDYDQDYDQDRDRYSDYYDEGDDLRFDDDTYF